METVSNIAVATAEIAAIRNLEFEISKRRDWGRIVNSVPLDWGLRESNQILREAVLNELFIFSFYEDMFTLRAFEEKLISLFTQFIKLIIFDIIKVGLFESFQAAVRGNREELILVEHLQRLLGQ